MLCEQITNLRIGKLKVERSSKLITNIEIREVIFFDNIAKAKIHFNQSIQNTNVWDCNHLDKWLCIDSRKIHFIVLANEDDWMKICGMSFNRIHFDPESSFTGNLVMYALSRWRSPK